MARERRREVLGLDAGIRIADLVPGDELAERAARRVDRNGKADAGGAAGVAPDLRVDSDHAPGGVEQRPTGASVGDRCVDLDRVDRAGSSATVSAAIERPTAETTPTASESSFPSGLPIAATGSPTTTFAERPSGTTSSACAAGVDADHADVVEDVPADDRRRHAVVVRELDVDLRRRLHRRAAAASPAFVITWAFVRIVPSLETTKPEPCASWPPRVREDRDDAGRALGEDAGG